MPYWPAMALGIVTWSLLVTLAMISLREQGRDPCRQPIGPYRASTPSECGRRDLRFLRSRDADTAPVSPSADIGLLVAERRHDPRRPLMAVLADLALTLEQIELRERLEVAVSRAEHQVMLDDQRRDP